MRNTLVPALPLALVALTVTACERRQEVPAQPAPAPPPPASTAPAPAEAPATPAEAPDEATPAPDPQVAPAPPAASEPHASAARTLPSGVVVEDVKVGDGPEATLASTVLVHYRGTLKNGETFDASDPAGPPIRFPLANLIQGWQEGIPGMKPGGVRRLTIPAAMAYGPEEIRDPATGRVVIPANSDLVFEITLVGVE